MDFKPPHSLESEKAIQSAMLEDPSLFHTFYEKFGLRPEHFFVDTHRKLFEAMINLDSKGAGLDVVNMITEPGAFDDVLKDIDKSYVLSLFGNAPLSQNLEFYSSIVKKKYYLRRIVAVCETTARKAVVSDGPVDGFIEEVEREFLSITSGSKESEGFQNAKQVLIPTLEQLERRISEDGTVTGVGSGFVDLDEVTGGWQKSDLVIMAARPGMGKTALALNWAMSAVKADEPKSVAIFTLEMSKEQLMERLLSAEGRIDSTALRKGDLSESDQDRLMNAARLINERGTKLVIDETPGISVIELRSRCRDYVKEHNLDLIIIDYLQLMRGTEYARKQGREREISEISMGLKSLAKELNVPIIACAQLNRGPDARTDKRPKISDLRESGSMEQDADMIIFVYRDDYYNPNSEHAGQAEIIIAKNRHGETTSVHLAWLPNFVSFHNLVRDNN